MSENTENKELLDAVNEAANEPDPESFDITDWLTPVSQKDHRPSEKVRLIRDFSLEKEIYELNGLEAQARKQQNDGPDPDATVSDSNGVSDLEARRADLHERIKAASVEVRVRAMLDPEIKKLQGKLKAPQSDYAVFAESIEFPGGTFLSAKQWPEFHNTIGEGQYQMLLQTFNRVSFGKPVTVNAPF